MKSTANSLTAVSTNTICHSSDNTYHTSICKSKKGTLVRFVISVANCYHKAYCEVLHDYHWHQLFDKLEVNGYVSYDYTGCARKNQLNGKYQPKPQFDDNLNLLKNHFNKVYATEI